MRESVVLPPRRAVTARALVLLLPMLAACPSAGVYRTARTLNQGELDVGLILSATHVDIPTTTTTDPQTGQPTTQDGVSFTLPNWVPELAVHYGITDDVELGGRVALSALMAEADLKLRLIGCRECSTHLAFAPAVNYRSFIFIEGPTATFPLIFTQDLRSDISLNLGGYGAYRDLHLVDSSGSSSSNQIDDFAIKSWLAGGSIGLEFHGSRNYVMPFVDVSRTINDVIPQTYVIVGISLGAITNRMPPPPPPSYYPPPPPPGYYPPPPPPPGYYPPPAPSPPPPQSGP
jgi:hypothetical protein